MKGGKGGLVNAHGGILPIKGFIPINFGNKFQRAIQLIGTVLVFYINLPALAGLQKE